MCFVFGFVTFVGIFFSYPVYEIGNFSFMGRGDICNEEALKWSLGCFQCEYLKITCNTLDPF